MSPCGCDFWRDSNTGVGRELGSGGANDCIGAGDCNPDGRHISKARGDNKDFSGKRSAGLGISRGAGGVGRDSECVHSPSVAAIAASSGGNMMSLGGLDSKLDDWTELGRSSRSEECRFSIPIASRSIFSRTRK